ncbi:hypothetical protein Tco_1160157, partial [Tanacetum coccineum]
LMESFVPFGGFLSMPYDIRSTLRISYYFGFLRHICDDKFKLEVNAISKVGLYGSVSDMCQSCLPTWSVRMDGVRVQDELKEYNGPRYEIETQTKVTKLFLLLDEEDAKAAQATKKSLGSWCESTFVEALKKFARSLGLYSSYPKDFEKIMLAKQTGLTLGQDAMKLRHPSLVASPFFVEIEA